MANSPMRAYGALLIVVATAVNDAVILSGFVMIDFVLDTAMVWGYMAAVNVMIVCAVAS